MKISYAGIALIMLVGCTRVENDGPDEQGYKWIKDGPITSPIIYHQGVDVFLNCGNYEHALSCAVHRSDGCHIYLPSDPKPWQKAHEIRHCEGWRHPDWTRGMGRP